MQGCCCAQNELLTPRKAPCRCSWLPLFCKLIGYNCGKMSHTALTKRIFIIHCNLILQAYLALKTKSIREAEEDAGLAAQYTKPSHDDAGKRLTKAYRDFGTGNVYIPTSFCMPSGINCWVYFTATDCIFNSRAHNVCNRPIWFKKKPNKQLGKVNNFCDLQLCAVLLLASPLSGRYLAHLPHSSLVANLF